MFGIGAALWAWVAALAARAATGSGDSFRGAALFISAICWPLLLGAYLLRHFNPYGEGQSPQNPRPSSLERALFLIPVVLVPSLWALFGLLVLVGVFVRG